MIDWESFINCLEKGLNEIYVWDYDQVGGSVRVLFEQNRTFRKKDKEFFIKCFNKNCEFEEKYSIDDLKVFTVKDRNGLEVELI